MVSLWCRIKPEAVPFTKVGPKWEQCLYGLCALSWDIDYGLICGSDLKYVSLLRGVVVELLMVYLSKYKNKCLCL
jgi:hypothetical protein